MTIKPLEPQAKSQQPIEPQAKSQEPRALLRLTIFEDGKVSLDYRVAPLIDLEKGEGASPDYNVVPGIDLEKGEGASQITLLTDFPNHPLLICSLVGALYGTTLAWFKDHGVNLDRVCPKQ